MPQALLLKRILLCSALVCASPGFSLAEDSTVIPLPGTWRFELDRKDSGVGEAWFNRDLSGTIKLPGTVSTNRLAPVSAAATPGRGPGSANPILPGCPEGKRLARGLRVVRAALNPSMESIL